MNLLHKRQQHVLQVGSLLQEPNPTQAVAVYLTDLKLNLKTMDFLTIWIHLRMFRHALEDSLIFEGPQFRKRSNIVGKCVFPRCLG